MRTKLDLALLLPSAACKAKPTYHAVFIVPQGRVEVCPWLICGLQPATRWYHISIVGIDTNMSDQDHPVSATAAHFGAGDLGLDALVPAVLCTFLATTVVGLRWYTRCKITHCIGLDDYVILLSLVGMSISTLPYE